MAGIRLDSGDLAYLSIEARRLLDAAGFADAAIVASNDLDEHVIASLKRQGATIAVWGVGTRLVTAYDQPALGGVYKLGALKSDDGSWQPKLKLSEQAVKNSTPGILQVRRYRNQAGAVADMIYDELREVPAAPTIVDPLDPNRRRSVDPGNQSDELLVPVLRGGKVVYHPPQLDAIRRRTQMQLDIFHPGVLRHEHPHQYPVGLEEGLYGLKTGLIQRNRIL
jgi:nicotinate phosphoribosyltransferase